MDSTLSAKRILCSGKGFGKAQDGESCNNNMYVLIKGKWLVYGVGHYLIDYSLSRSTDKSLRGSGILSGYIGCFVASIAAFEASCVVRIFVGGKRLERRDLENVLHWLSASESSWPVQGLYESSIGMDPSNYVVRLWPISPHCTQQSP